MASEYLGALRDVSPAACPALKVSLELVWFAIVAAILFQGSTIELQGM